MPKVEYFLSKTIKKPLIIAATTIVLIVIILVLHFSKNKKSTSPQSPSPTSTPNKPLTIEENKPITLHIFLADDEIVSEEELILRTFHPSSKTNPLWKDIKAFANSEPTLKKITDENVSPAKSITNKIAKKSETMLNGDNQFNKGNFRLFLTYNKFYRILEAGVSALSESNAYKNLDHNNIIKFNVYLKHTYFLLSNRFETRVEEIINKATFGNKSKITTNPFQNHKWKKAESLMIKIRPFAFVISSIDYSEKVAGKIHQFYTLKGLYYYKFYTTGNLLRNLYSLFKINETGLVGEFVYLSDKIAEEVVKNGEMERFSNIKVEINKLAQEVMNYLFEERNEYDIELLAKAYSDLGEYIEEIESLLKEDN